jgi:hypothetical protein
MTKPDEQMPELKSCPFCGGKPYVYYDTMGDVHREVGCHECNYHFVCDFKDVPKVWNTRTAPVSDATGNFETWFTRQYEQRKNPDFLLGKKMLRETWDASRAALSPMISTAGGADE